MRYTVTYYTTRNGNCPVGAFILSLFPKLQAKAIRTIDMLENNGNELREPYTKHLRNGIFELRIIFGNDIARILFFYCSDNTIVLTNGFIKKTDKTPKGELLKSELYRRDYLERNGM